MDVIFKLLLLAAFLILSAFFSGSETVMMSLNPLQVRRLTERNRRGGDRVRRLLARPAQLLSAVLIANTFVNVGFAAVSYSLAERWVPGRGDMVAIPLTTLILLFFGEIAPKRYGLAHAERMAPAMTPLLAVAVRATRPLRWVLEYTTAALQHLFHPHGRSLSGKEFETVLDIGGEEGTLDADEWAMAKSVFRLDDLKAVDVMTPRVDLEGIDLNDSTLDLEAAALQARRKQLLLYRGQIDEVEGFLDVRRFLLDTERRSEKARITPVFVPELAPLNRVLELFRETNRHLAVVVDEYGGTAGVISRGDICEEITGTTYDHLSQPGPVLRTLGPAEWLVDPHFSLEELNRRLRLHLHAESADRLSGWITEQAGHLPRRGDVFEAQGCRVSVLQTRRHRLTLARVERLEPST